MKYLLLCDNTKVEETASLCRVENLGIEAQAFFHPLTLDDPDAEIEKHKKLLWGITPRSMHGPFAEMAPGSLDPQIRSVCRRRMLQAVDIAKKLNIEQIVFHHGYYPNTSLPSKWNERIGKFFKDLLKTVPDNMVFHLENLFENDIDMMKNMLDAIESPRVDLCLDTGHAHAFSGIPVTEWIEKLGQRIGYVHLHSNNGRKDEHIGLHRGTMPSKDVCQALNDYSPDAIWGIEAHDEDISPSLDWLRENNFV